MTSQTPAYLLKDGFTSVYTAIVSKAGILKKEGNEGLSIGGEVRESGSSDSTPGGYSQVRRGDLGGSHKKSQRGSGLVWGLQCGERKRRIRYTGDSVGRRGWQE